MSEDKTKRFKEEDSKDKCKSLPGSVIDTDNQHERGIDKIKPSRTLNDVTPKEIDPMCNSLSTVGDTIESSSSCGKTELKNLKTGTISANKSSGKQADGGEEHSTNLKTYQVNCSSNKTQLYGSKQQCLSTNCDSSDKHKPPVFKQNIFNVKKPKDDTSKPSPFLSKQDTTNNVEVPLEPQEQHEEETFIFRKPCTHYKFMKKWEKIGSCTVYLTEKDNNKRLYVSREGTMSRPVDVFLNYDCKPYIKRNGVGFIIFKEEEGKVVGKNILLLFEAQDVVNAFYKLLKK